MNDEIIYSPYKAEKWIALLLIFCAMVSCFFAGYVGFRRLDGVVICIIVGCLCAWLSKCLYNDSNIIVRFESEGIRIVAGFNVGYHYILWENFSYAYYVSNAKGHQRLILSPKELVYKEAKQLVNDFAFSAKIYVDECIVIPCDNSPIGKSISALIEQRVPNVHTLAQI